MQPKTLVIIGIDGLKPEVQDLEFVSQDPDQVRKFLVRLREIAQRPGSYFERTKRTFVVYQPVENEEEFFGRG